MSALKRLASIILVMACVMAIAAPPSHAQTPPTTPTPPKKKKNLNGGNGPEGLLEKPAPALVFKAYGTGQSIDLKDYAGKLVVIDIFNAENGRDSEKFDILSQIEQDYGKKGVSIIGISTDVNQSEIVRLLKKKSIDWPFSYDGLGWSGELSEAWHVATSTGSNSYSYYPRIDYLVSPDGIVVWHGNPDDLEDGIKQAMKDHKPSVVDPRTMAEAKAVLDKVTAAINDEKLVEAYRQRAHIPHDAKNDDDFAASLKDVDDKLQSASDTALAAVDPLIADKKFDEAAAKLKELATAFDGTPMAAKVKAKLNELQKDPDARAAIQTAEKNSRANDLLTIAQKMQADKKDVAAYGKYKMIVKEYPGSPAASTATDAITAYDADPGFKKKLAAGGGADPAVNASQSPTSAPGKTEGGIDPARANGLLGLANSYRDAGNIEKAKAKYQDVITQFPNTPQAATAKEELAKLPG